MNKDYKVSIRYFLLMSLMLLLTGIWMLLLHTSLSVDGFSNYYVQKSVFGLLEVATPHLFAMGTVIFILTHFLSLNRRNSSFESKLTLALFTVMIVSNLSGFIITEQTTYLVWVKIISTVLFLVFSLLSMWRVFLRTS